MLYKKVHIQMDILLSRLSLVLSQNSDILRKCLLCNPHRYAIHENYLKMDNQKAFLQTYLLIFRMDWHLHREYLQWLVHLPSLPAMQTRLPESCYFSQTKLCLLHHPRSELQLLLQNLQSLAPLILLPRLTSKNHHVQTLLPHVPGIFYLPYINLSGQPVLLQYDPNVHQRSDKSK